MPQAKKQAAFSTELPNPFAVADMDALGAQQSAALAEINGTALKSIAELHHEVSVFIDHRLQKDLELQKSLTKCKSAADAMQTCANFWQDTFREYWQETAKLSDMAMRTQFVATSERTEHKAAAE